MAPVQSLEYHPMTRSLLVLGALVASSPALAADSTYMWGGGLGIGTMVAPGAYPVYFPSAVNDAADAGRSTIEAVGGDFKLSGEGVYYLDGANRVGAQAGLTFGSGFSDRNVMMKYAKVTDFGAADGILGGGAGVGRSVWKTDTEERLDIPYYPVRVEIGAMHRDKDWAVQGILYGQYNWEANGRSYINQGGNEVDVGRGLYAMMGIELTGMIGDFKPPKSDKSSGSKSSGSKSSGSKSSGSKSSGSKSSGSKSSGDKSGGDKSSGDKSGGKSSGDKSGGKSSGDKSSGGKSGGKSSGGKSGGKSSGSKSSGDKSGGSKSSGDKSGADKSSGDKSSGDKSGADKSGADAAGGGA